MSVALVVLTAFLLAAAAPLMHRLAGARTGVILACATAAIAFWLAYVSGPVVGGQVVAARIPWAPGLGVDLSFRLDGLGLLFGLLISGIGALVLLYAGGYLKGHPHLGRFYGFLLLFLGSMLGVATAGNLLLLFVFWELTSVSSYLLIGFDYEKKESRASALQALLVTGGGGLALLAGVLMLGGMVVSWEIGSILRERDAIQSHALYLPALVLILLGAFTKSAQWPFHFWLPGAMAAPTPVSAYLHSATMVKAGVFLLARLHPVLAGTEAWTLIVSTTGAITLVSGGVLALFQTDLKRLLAYSTVSALGALVMLLGIGTPAAVRAAMVFLLAHALYKGALFLIAGVVDHETGTRDVTRLGGLRAAMPITAGVAMAAGVSLAGFGPVFSFIGKEMLLDAALSAPRHAPLLVSAAVLSGALFVVVAAAVTVRPFYGALRATPRPAHEAPPSLWLGPAVLATAGVLLGVAPGLIAERLIAPSVAAVLGRPEPVSLALWHGVNAALGLSVLGVACGAGLYLLWDRYRGLPERIGRASAIGPAAAYGVLLEALNRIARWQTGVLQSGYLRRYLLVILLTLAGLTLHALWTRGRFVGAIDLSDVRVHEAVVSLLILAAAVGVVRSRNRLGAVALLGVVGYGVALLYVLFGAPDLAMTQLAIETLTVILFVFAFYHLPRFSPRSGSGARLRDLIACCAVGGTITLLLLGAAAEPHPTEAARFFADNSWPQANGRNVVNVILVDFRALDTLGEITVLSVAAIGVYAILRLRPHRKGGA